MSIVEGILAIAVVFVWWLRLERLVPFRLAALGIVLIVGGTAALVQPVTGLFHESWAALLMALMIGLRRPGHAAGAIVAGTIALLVRETVLPMILVMGALALFERRWREALGWTLAVALPRPLAAIVLLLSLFGWASVRTGWALRTSLLLLGYGAMLALFARADTFYWALLVAPLSLAGLIFVPRAIATLVSATRRVAQPAA
jgi:hypothetical protein